MKGFGGLPGGGGMQAIMKQAQKMQQDIKKAQEEAEKFTAEATSGGGMVKAVAGGKNQLLSLTLNKEIVNPNELDLLQDTIVAAVNEAMEKVRANSKAAIAKVTGGIDLPGM